MKIQLGVLRHLIVNYLMTNKGYNSKDAHIIKEFLMYAFLRANSQGLGKLLAPLPAGIPDSCAEAEYNITGNLLTASKGNSMVALYKAMSWAIKESRQKGFTAIGIAGTSNSSGAIGYISNYLAKKGFASILFAATPPYVAPRGTAKGFVGTNPVAIGIPCKPFPITIDATTAALPLMEILQTEGLLPYPALILPSGKTSNDPKELAKGAALLPAGKLGGALGLAIQLIAGAMTGNINWGHFMMVIDPHHFNIDFESLCNEWVQSMTELPRIDRDPILLPGWGGEILTQQIEQLGEVGIHEEIFSLLSQ